MSHSSSHTFTRCTNCGAELTGEYCSNCGQKKFSPHDLELSKFTLNFFEDFFKFDSNVFRTIKCLLFKPGFLTAEYVRGRIARYVKPLKLFVFTCIVVFFLGQYISKNDYRFVHEDLIFFGEKIEKVSEENNITKDAFIERFNNNYFSKIAFYYLVIVIFFTLVLSLVFIKQKRVIGQHLVFSLHFYTACLILTLLDSIVDNVTDAAYYTFFFVIPFIYLFIAMKTFYGKKNLSAVFITVFLYVFYFLIQYYWIILTGYITLKFL